MFEFLKQLTNPESIIQYGGLALLLFVIFAETGLFFGFFLPGDSLVFIAGMFCSSKPELLNTNIFLLIALLCCSAIIGNAVGYWFGKKIGPPLFKRKDSLFFKKKYLEITDEFYKKNGGATIILGRFLPIIRTFAPILAGVIKINFRKFMIYNIAGAVLWISSLSCIGYYLGTYQWVQDNVKYIVIALIIITTIPIIIAWAKKKKIPD